MTQDERPGFNKYMLEQREVSRWFILRVALMGAFAGVLLAVAFMIAINVLVI